MRTVHFRAVARKNVRRALTVVVVLGLAASVGVVAAAARPAEEAHPPVAAAPAAPDLTPITDQTSALIRGLRADLPIPEPSPLDPRAPTPVVQHGMLEIPSIGLKQPLFEGVTLTAVDNGPSHWPGTPMPGELGNMVIAGHRVTNTRPFFDLDLAKPGDELIFTMNDGRRIVYTLDRIEIVEADALHIVDQDYDYRATLFGCHPKGSARQRIVGHFTLQT
jgi:sortase A